MKIALIVDNFNPHGGGAERSAAQIAAELVRRGHEVTVLAGAAPLGELSPGVEVERFAKRKPRSALRLLWFSRWVRRRLRPQAALATPDSEALAEGGGRFDVSLSITMAAAGTVLQPRGGTIRETLERNVARRRNRFARWLKRGLIHLTPKYLVQLYLERRTLADPRVRRIAAVSRYVAQQLSQHYDVDASRVEVIPNAAVMPELTDAQRQQWRERIRHGLHIAENATVYLFIAKNPLLKGYEPLLRALRRLKDQGEASGGSEGTAGAGGPGMAGAEGLVPASVDGSTSSDGFTSSATPAPPAGPAVVLLVGDFYYPMHLRAVAAGVRDRVRFLGQTRQAAAAYAAADVTVLPTFYDPSSKVVIESLMLGVPAITSRCNGASDFIEPVPGETDGPGAGEPGAGTGGGIIVPDPADDVALAQAMTTLADGETRRRCARATAGLAPRLSMARHVDQLEHLLQHVYAEEPGQTSEAPAQPRTQ